MKKTSFRAKLFWFFIVFLVSVNIAILITGNSYIYKALVYTYADIDDLDVFQTRIVEKGKPEPWLVSAQYNKQPLPPALQSELEKNKSVAFLIIKNDSIYHEQYWDHYDQNSLSNSFSVAKSIVSTLVGIAVDEGKIKSIDEPVGNYISHFKEGKNAQLTIRQLLTMSAGLNWDESYSSLFSITTKAYYGRNLEKLVSGLDVVTEPGKKFDYMSGCTQLLALIVETATGKSLSEYASDKIWKRIGAEQSAHWSLDHPNGNEKAYCCFYSNARDFARYGKLYLDSGEWNGQQIVSKNYVKESLTPAPIDFTGNEPDCYGFQWWLTEQSSHKIFYARGLRGQYIVVIPDKQIIFVRLGTERPEPSPDHRLSDLPLYIDGVLQMAGG